MEQMVMVVVMVAVMVEVAMEMAAVGMVVAEGAVAVAMVVVVMVVVVVVVMVTWDTLYVARYIYHYSCTQHLYMSHRHITEDQVFGIKCWLLSMFF